MTNHTNAQCRHCGTPLPVHHAGACPACGQTGKEITLAVDETVRVHSHATWMRERREIVKKRRWAKRLILGSEASVAVAGLWLAAPVSVACGLLALGVTAVYGQRWVERVIPETSSTVRPYGMDQELRITRQYGGTSRPLVVSRWAQMVRALAPPRLRR